MVSLSLQHMRNCAKKSHPARNTGIFYLLHTLRAKMNTITISLYFCVCLTAGWSLLLFHKAVTQTVAGATSNQNVKAPICIYLQLISLALVNWDFLLTSWSQCVLACLSPLAFPLGSSRLIHCFS